MIQSKNIIKKEKGFKSEHQRTLYEKMKKMNECMRNFYNLPGQDEKSEKDKIPIGQLIHVKSGTLILQGCSLSIEAPLNFRARCIYQEPRTTTILSFCKLRGGGPQKNVTAGVYVENANTIIQNCQFVDFKSGGVIADLKPENTFIFRDNALASCLLASVYVQGTNSKPIIIKNVFMYCKNETIVVYPQVKGFIAMN